MVLVISRFALRVAAFLLCKKSDIPCLSSYLFMCIKKLQLHSRGYINIGKIVLGNYLHSFLETVEILVYVKILASAQTLSIV